MGLTGPGLQARAPSQAPPPLAGRHRRGVVGGQSRRCRGSSKLTTAMARPSPAAMRKTRS
ncbi:hypothetical protein [Nonomuraea basaltis]|uniref:hypothetical protein n=1 Tax=Nonomuraea basaltis TaxID=2495887 RepID=UPI00110C5C35|nr:hypothetical protein [Nonomuraea basaltis]TMR99762.1 hypothetical protein EJK15_05700 [Nonomuraea basaltis]